MKKTAFNQETKIDAGEIKLAVYDKNAEGQLAHPIHTLGAYGTFQYGKNGQFTGTLYYGGVVKFEHNEKQYKLNQEELLRIIVAAVEKEEGIDLDKIGEGSEISDKHSHVITVGDTVDVDETDDNQHFTGEVVGFKKDGLVSVRDMEDNVFDVEPTQVEVQH